MSVTGSDAAIESADVAFTGSNVRLIPVALAHARRDQRIMTGNIGLALAIIVVLFPLALFGVLGLAAVVLVHEVAEVIVIGNGLRAGRMPRQLTSLPESTPATPPQVITSRPRSSHVGKERRARPFVNVAAVHRTSTSKGAMSAPITTGR